MTREEAINRIQAMVYYMDSLNANEAEQKDIEAYRMAIKALKQEPCDDAVSRQEILNKINEVCFGEKWKGFRIDYGSNGQRDFLIDYIKQMSSVTPQEPKWIPVSERLPEISTWVLATYKDRDGDICLDIMIINEWTGSWESRFDDDDFADGFIANVIAWMPLPAPYEPQERSDRE